jgi:hypothetical protein
MGFGQCFERTMEFQLVLLEGQVQGLEEATAKKTGQDADGQEEAVFARYPALTVRGQSAAGYDTVHMRVVQEILSPSVQDGDKSDLDAQMLGISGKFEQSLRNRTEQNVIKGLLIPQDKRIKFPWNGKNHMEVWDRKEIFFPLFKPSLFGKELTFRAVSVSA